MRQDLVRVENYYRLCKVRSHIIQAITVWGTFAEKRQINVRRPRCQFLSSSILRQTRPFHLYLTGTWVSESAQSSGQRQQPAVGHCLTQTTKLGSQEVTLASIADYCVSWDIQGRESRC
jgi:hypothetical protein